MVNNMIFQWVDNQIVSYLIYKNNIDFINDKIDKVHIFLMGAINQLMVDFYKKRY